MGGAELAGEGFALGVGVHRDYFVRADHPRALGDIQPDSAESENHHIVAGAHFCGVYNRAHAGGDAAADVAGQVKGRVFRILATAISGRTVKLEKVEVPM